MAQTAEVETFTNTMKGNYFAYMMSMIITLLIFILGFRWTLFGLYLIPFVLNPVIYLCVVAFWLYYNYCWLRTALYLPTTYFAIRKLYKMLGVNLSWWRAIYISLCKINRVRKEDIKMRKTFRMIKIFAATFIKQGLLVNLSKKDSYELSKAVFIRYKHKVLAVYKKIYPYFLPIVLVMIVLTSLTVFLSPYNHRFFLEHFIEIKRFEAFGLYLCILPLKFVWVLLILSHFATNMISPMITMKCNVLFVDYVNKENVKLDLKRGHHLPFEGFAVFFMIVASLYFYISLLSDILL